MIKCSPEDYNKPCIYKITCLKNNKIYIGQTDRFKPRMQCHKWNVEHPNQASTPWYRYCNKHLGATNFEKDFDAEIIEIVEDPKLRDERERYWIDKLDACNPEVGFNTLKGGYESKKDWKRRKNRFTYKRGKNCTKFTTYFVYDTLTDTVEMLMSIRSVLEYTNTNAMRTINYFILINNRYYVVVCDCVRRRKYFDEYLKSKLSIIKNLIDGNNNSRTIAECLLLINRINTYRRLEYLISRDFADCEGVTDGKTIRYCHKLSKKVHELYIELYSRTAVAYDLRAGLDVQEELVVIYNFIEKRPIKICTVKEAADFLGIKKDNALAKMKSIIPIKGSIYVYPIDQDIKEVFRKAVKASSLTLGPKSPHRNNMYPYMCGYYTTNTFLGINSLITDF